MLYKRLFACISLIAVAFTFITPGASFNIKSGITKDASYSDQIIVMYNDGTSSALKVRPGETAAHMINEYAGRSDIIFAEADPIVTAASLPNDALYNTYQSTVFDAMAITHSWDYTTGDSSLIVAVLDSGVDYEHPDLSGRLLDNGYDFVNDDKDSSDDNGHGTVVAGIIAANTNNSKGIAGASNCMIMPVKVLNSQGKGYASNIADGIKYAADNGADVINLSCGTSLYSQAVEDAVNYAHDAGIIVVASTGNTGLAIEYPAACQNAIAVGSVISSKEYAAYSCYGSEIDLVAVGTGVASTTYNNGKSAYANATGTSFSAPFVSALAVLSLSLDDSLTPDNMKTIMEKNAVDVGTSGWDEYTGYGCINFYDTLKYISENDNDTVPVVMQTSDAAQAAIN